MNVSAPKCNEQFKFQPTLILNYFVFVVDFFPSLCHFLNDNERQKSKGAKKKKIISFQIACDLSFFSHSTIKCCFSLSPMFTITQSCQPKKKIIQRNINSKFMIRCISDFIALAIHFVCVFCSSSFWFELKSCLLFLFLPIGWQFHKNYIVRINLFRFAQFEQSSVSTDHATSQTCVTRAINNKICAVNVV